MSIFYRLFLVLTLFMSFSYAQSNAQKKAEINSDSRNILKMLYKHHPEAKVEIENAYGYATFSNIGVNVILFSAEGGSGVAVNNDTNKRVYMKMASGGVGFGVGIKDFRAVFIFDNKKVFDTFVNSGWEANAQADAAAKSDKKGGSIEGAVTVQPGVHLYKLTKNGLVIQATIQGTKYWKDKDLN